jgi:hypothetical protein
MAQTQPGVEQPATESTNVDEALDKLFGGSEEPAEQPETQEPEAQEGEEAQATEETAAESEPELVEIEVDGETWQVPPKLKDRFMAQKDYTEKSTETARLKDSLSLQQKEVALFQEQRAFEQSVQDDIDYIKMLDSYIKHEKASTPWATLTTDAAFKKKMELEGLADQRTQKAIELQSKRDAFSAKVKGEREKLKSSANEFLRKAIPSWDKDWPEVKKFAISLGAPEDELDNYSPIAKQLLWESQQYRKIKAETKVAVKKAATAPVIAQSARKKPMPKQVRTHFDLKNAVKSGNRDKIAAGLDARLDQLFGG